MVLEASRWYKSQSCRPYPKWSEIEGGGEDRRGATRRQRKRVPCSKTFQPRQMSRQHVFSIEWK